MIWTLGDFNSVYLLTGGGPADLTHVLATLGIRYLRLDQVDLAMAAIVCAMPLVLPLVYFMMKRLSEMKLKDAQRHRSEAAPDRHPGAAVDDTAGLPHVPVLDLAEGVGLRRQAVARSSDAAQLRGRFPGAALLPEPFLAAALELAADRGQPSAR